MTATTLPISVLRLGRLEHRARQQRTAREPRKQGADQQRSGELESLADEERRLGADLIVAHRSGPHSVHRSTAGSSERSRHMPLRSASVPPGAISAVSSSSGKLAIIAMRDRTDHQIVAPAVRLGDLEPMLALDLLGRRDRIRDLDLVAEPLQPPDDVEAAAVAEVGNILLEGQAEHQRACPALRAPVVKRIGDPRAHAVVGLRGPRGSPADRGRPAGRGG